MVDQVLVFLGVAIIRMFETFAQLYLFASITGEKIKHYRYIIAIIVGTVILANMPKFISFKWNYLIAYLVFVSVIIIFLRVKWNKAFIGYTITSILVVIIDIILSIIIKLLLNFDSLEMIQVNAVRNIAQIVLIFILFILAIIIKKVDLKIFKEIVSYRNISTLFNILITFIIILPNVLMIILFVNKFNDEGIYPIIIAGVNIVAMVLLFFLSIYNTKRRYDALIANEELEIQKNYNETLKGLTDSLRTFKHDYDNTLATIYGYIQLENMGALKKMFSQVIDETKSISSLERLNPDIVKNPSIFGLLNSKYKICIENNIAFNIEIFGELDKADIKIFDLTRILGIFLDNAIEATNSSENKKITLFIYEFENNIIIELSNEYSKTSLKTQEIFAKGVSTKGEGRGLGLFKVKDILKRYPKVSLETTMEEKMFQQKLCIPKGVKESKVGARC